MTTRVSIVFLLLLHSLFLSSMGKVHFLEEFGPDWESRWIKSDWRTNQQGTLIRTKGLWYGDDEMSYGVQTRGNRKYFARSARLESPFVTAGVPFVLQYSVKFEEDIECGGGYIKLVKEGFDPKSFGGETPMLAMFGPDLCGKNNKVHLILDYKGTGYLWKKQPMAPNDRLTHVYTMVLYPNSTYAVYVDMKLLENGTLEQDWEFGAPKYINDPSEKKPEDWDDRMYIEDPNSKKPADWVEEELVDDTKAKKPQDWNDAKEGQWQPPKTKNPKYKGPWTPSKVYNPKYSGVWKLKVVPNPDYKLVEMEPYKIGGVGVDVWQTRAGTIFGNIMLADSLEDAFSRAKLIVASQDKEREFKKEYDRDMEQKANEVRKRLDKADQLEREAGEPTEEAEARQEKEEL